MEVNYGLYKDPETGKIYQQVGGDGQKSDNMFVDHFKKPQGAMLGE